MQAFIDLIQRHEQSFYHFVHKVHSKGETLFDSLMRWIELFLTIVREGLGAPVSLEFLLPHTGKAREEIFAEVDKVALYHYKLKVAYEAKIRRRFGRMQQSGGADEEDEATQALVNGVVGEIDFGELIQGDADDLAAEETDDESDEYDDDDDSEYGSTEDSDDDSEEETSSEENQTPRRSAAVPISRSETLKANDNVPRPNHTPPVSRKRSMLSLRSMKSMNLSRRSQDHPPVPPLPTSRSATSDLASKPLPPSPTSHSFHDHGPPTPSKLGYDSSSIRSSSTKQGNESLRTQPSPSKSSHGSPRLGMHDSPSQLSHASSSRHSRASSKQSDESSRRKTKKKKKASAAVQPPELEHIPQLLPVFIEMVQLIPFLPVVPALHVHTILPRCGHYFSHGGKRI